jgi:hypothetical protein
VIIWQGRGGITALIIVLSIVIVLVLINLMGWRGPDWATYFASRGVGQSRAPRLAFRRAAMPS